MSFRQRYQRVNPTSNYSSSGSSDCYDNEKTTKRTKMNNVTSSIKIPDIQQFIDRLKHGTFIARNKHKMKEIGTAVVTGLLMLLFVLKTIGLMGSIASYVYAVTMIQSPHGFTANPRKVPIAMSGNKQKADLHKSIHKMIQLEKAGNIVRLEDEVHRATNRFCLPQLDFTLDRNALERLDVHVMELVDFIARGYHFHKYGELAVARYGGVVDASDPLRTLDAMSKCPLIDAMFTMGKLQKERHNVNERSEQKEYDIASLMFGDGVKMYDIEHAVLALTKLLMEGKCSDIGSQLPKGAVKEITLQSLAAIYNFETSNTTNRVASDEYYFDRKGNMFVVHTDEDKKRVPLNAIHCKSLDNFIHNIDHEHDWTNSVTLSAIAHLSHEHFDRALEDVPLTQQPKEEQDEETVEVKDNKVKTPKDNKHVDDTPKKLMETQSVKETVTEKNKDTNKEKSEEKSEETTVKTKASVSENDYTKWDNEQVIQWLSQIGGGEYVDTFRKNHVRGVDLSEMANDDLKKEMKIEAFGDRKLIERALKQLKEQVTKTN